jgi:hypothetical protein
MRAPYLSRLGIVGMTAVLFAAGNEGCVPGTTGGYASMQNCDLQNIQSRPLKVAYLDKQYVTQNQVVIAKMKALNQPYVFASTCEKDATAIPEWYLKYLGFNSKLSNDPLLLVLTVL